MNSVSYTSVDRLLAKLHRDLKGLEINESDTIEWIGEALGFLQIPQVQEQAVAFLEVENHETIVPAHFNMVIQISRKIGEHKSCCPSKMEDCKCEDTPTRPKEETTGCICTDCQGNLIGTSEKAYYRPYFDLQWEYNLWRDNSFYRQNFVPVRLSDHTFFNTVVCREQDSGLYKRGVPCDEYTIVGTSCRKLRFSFKDGFIALSYLRSSVDPDTGFPLIPDVESCIAAVTYYVKWKLAEWRLWTGKPERQEAELVADLERKWLHYVKQFKNYLLMPKSFDEFQNLLEQTLAIPNMYKYNNYFGNYNYKSDRRSMVWIR